MHLAQDILLSMASLPPFPIVLQRAIDLLNNPDSSIQDVVDSIQFDQSITANVLKICNSAYFGFKRRVYSLKEALVLMGFRQLIEIILSQEALNLFSNSNSQYKELWLHSVGCAFLSGLTARRLRERTTPIFFTVALLHDIGKLALAKFVKNYLWDTNKCIQEEEISFTEAEK
jgi:HD-like signal output (HDOD) protein